MKINRDTENKIFDNANEVFLLKGYCGVTMDDIACRAKVNKAALYYYFRSKKKLYAIALKFNLEILSDSLKKYDFGVNNQFNTPMDINIQHVVWFIVSELKVNSLIITEIIKEDANINDLLYFIFNAKNCKILEKFITTQFDEIVTQILQR
jgi:AcrR family transcriptional regulator